MPKTIKKHDDAVVFLYDGDCGFCNSTVRFLLSNSSEESLSFAPLQSKFAKELFKKNGLSSPDLQAAYLWNGKMHKASDAVLRAYSYTRRPYKWLKFFIIIPPFIRNFFYYTIARNRKRISFLNDSCRLLTPTEKKRFI